MVVRAAPRKRRLSMGGWPFVRLRPVYAIPRRPRKGRRYFFPEERRAEDHWGSSTVPEARMAKILENGVVSQ